MDNSKLGQLIGSEKNNREPYIFKFYGTSIPFVRMIPDPLFSPMSVLSSIQLRGYCPRSSKNQGCWVGAVVKCCSHLGKKLPKSKVIVDGPKVRPTVQHSDLLNIINLIKIG